MERFDNPFHDLWVTEILNPDEYVRMFSPFVVTNASDLYSTGNVVVRGTQGSGKSMLLNLLSTSTRLAYAKAGIEYPVPDNKRNFISAGMHMIRDNARLVASRISEVSLEKKKSWVAATFGDYVNYVLAHDLLRNVKLLADEQEKTGLLSKEISVVLGAKADALFVRKLVESDAWVGYLDGCGTVEEVMARMSDRLRAYRRYFNFNDEKLDESVESTKTGVGEPLGVVADALRSAHIVPAVCQFFLRLDQHEELYVLEETSGFAGVFRQVLNRMLALRDSRVSYRIGTRHYAWDVELKVWGSGAKLEIMRDYVVIDLDEIFRRKESKSFAGPFDDFAEDVFRRRLEATNFHPDQKDALTQVFGKSLTATERAAAYVKTKGPVFGNMPTDWDPQWKKELSEMWTQGEPLQARLGVAWLRQSAQQLKGVHRDRNSVSGYPWRLKKYWIKERNEAALVQLAGDLSQALAWSGKRHIVELSGANILAFMSICRAIWGAWLRNLPDEELRSIVGVPGINRNAQAIGISEASKIWFEKLAEGLDGDRRKTFIVSLGTWFSSKIRDDEALSNPGHNGFSLKLQDLDSDREIGSLIKNCRDHGDLVEREHTTKLADAKLRRKWYLSPLLCPYFRIPYIQTKEPIYANVAQLRARYEAIQRNDDPPGTRKQRRDNQSGTAQRNLFE